MKKLFCALAISAVFASCQSTLNTKTYLPRTISANEKFNDPQPELDSAFKVVQISDDKRAGTPEDPKIWYQIKRGDTTIKIQTNPSDAASGVIDFKDFTFVNTQKTCLLAQVKDSSGLTAPFYLIAFKDGKVDIVSLYRASKGSQDDKLMGLSRIGRDGYVINHDFFITNVNAKLYFIKRPDENERIKGQFIVKSPDKQTLVFLMPSSDLYQVNYITNDTYTVPLGIKADLEGVYTHIQTKFRWDKDKKGVQFLKPGNDDRIVDISEFK
ncbi:hypothetical protein [Pedobacter sp. GR22-6]|uniref:hypothetical protein n=1 Tax=Pedobacter sp. GR22-6 TaxID=3127957 RepID=UPI00307D440F